MNGSQRVKLIKTIGKKLSDEEYGIVDLTLRQFILPTSDTFEGDKTNYIIYHIGTASDEQLIELADHLELEAGGKSELNPGFWHDLQFRLFISHLATDKINAQDLKRKLEKFGICGFVAHTDIEPTTEWQEQIELALRTCDALVALLVPAFDVSKWTDQEIGFALGRDLLVIPIRCGKDPYGFIGKYQAITFTSMQEVAEGIFTSLITNKKTSKKMAYAVVNRFLNAESFAEAKQLMDNIEQVQTWDDKLLKILDGASALNDQIKYSFGVPDRIQSLIKKSKKT